MSRGYIEDAKNTPAPKEYTANELVGWCLSFLVLGGLGGYVVAGILFMGSC